MREAVRLILETEPGERVMRPDFGCGLLDLTFEPNSPELAASLQISIQAALQRWLGDVIDISSLDVESQVWLRRNARSPWVVDLPITPDRGGLWTNKRWADHVVPVQEATWVAADGIRYLRPEIALLCKAALDRDKDRRDVDVAWPLLDDAARAWLLGALDAVHPGHAWRARLAI